MVKGAHDYTFAELAQKIGEARGKEAKLTVNTTARFITSTRIGIKLHNTDVIIVGADGTYQLFTGDHKTKTTTDRICGFSPVRVKSLKGSLFVDSADGLVPFCEGIKVDRAGRVIGGCKTPSCNSGKCSK